ncbi:hypothetical protein UFOVP965_24 [uncultured Caudovirales phage]|uniref:Uncharacterized protein n=1 Tax=uncultured Caudovirales phage TaxID=2100421 RepID=A0A6J5QBB2_9CAUD|nr:hypothetical protein UFOVP965_24 [uncultured Caudovirales phage]CAB4179727.1 hypothetical protein UFOVP1035_20 [uncultured Caudovirales phage]CAB4188843.1 hypothetical protein UFOVP1181_126 [uncultured Caudovirales phage]
MKSLGVGALSSSEKTAVAAANGAGSKKVTSYMAKASVVRSGERDRAAKAKEPKKTEAKAKPKPKKK